MNELIEITKNVATCSQNEVSKQMMTVFRAVTPQFYKSMTDSELRAEMLSIKLLTQNIDQQTLAEMCRLSVEGYATNRSENPKIYFDINYVLTYYVEAFNNVHCYNVKLPQGAELISNVYDKETKKIHETWQANGVLYDIQFIDTRKMTQENSRRFSPKFNEYIFEEFINMKL